jgi:hypothetical protein
MESVNDILKNQCQIEHTRHRSFDNFTTNLISGLFAYAFYPTKPNINIDNLQRIGQSLNRTHVIYYTKQNQIGRQNNNKELQYYLKTIPILKRPTQYVKNLGACLIIKPYLKKSLTPN